MCDVTESKLQEPRHVEMELPRVASLEPRLSEEEHERISGTNPQNPVWRLDHIGAPPWTFIKVALGWQAKGDPSPYGWTVLHYIRRSVGNSPLGWNPVARLYGRLIGSLFTSQFTGPIAGFITRETTWPIMTMLDMVSGNQRIYRPDDPPPQGGGAGRGLPTQYDIVVAKHDTDGVRIPTAHVRVCGLISSSLSGVQWNPSLHVSLQEGLRGWLYARWRRQEWWESWTLVVHRQKASRRTGKLLFTQVGGWQTMPLMRSTVQRKRPESGSGRKVVPELLSSRYARRRAWRAVR